LIEFLTILSTRSMIKLYFLRSRYGLPLKGLVCDGDTNMFGCSCEGPHSATVIRSNFIRGLNADTYWDPSRILGESIDCLNDTI